MKKFCILFTMVLLLASCQQENNNGIEMNTITFDVSSWTTGIDADNNIYYSCVLDVPEITNAFYSNGTVMVYSVLSDAQAVLPYIRNFRTNGGVLWTRTVDYDFSPGKITVYVTNSDLVNEAPSPMSFRVALLR